MARLASEASWPSLPVSSHGVLSVCICSKLLVRIHSIGLALYPQRPHFHLVTPSKALPPNSHNLRYQGLGHQHEFGVGNVSHNNSAHNNWHLEWVGKQCLGNTCNAFGAHLILLNRHDVPMKLVMLLWLFYRWEHWSPNGWSPLPKVTEQVAEPEQAQGWLIPLCCFDQVGLVSPVFWNFKLDFSLHMICLM